MRSMSNQRENAPLSKGAGATQLHILIPKQEKMLSCQIFPFFKESQKLGFYIKSPDFKCWQLIQNYIGQYHAGSTKHIYSLKQIHWLQVSDPLVSTIQLKLRIKVLP